MPDSTNAATIQLPDLSAWQKALPYIIALATAAVGAFASGNWMALGAEALKDLPAIFQTVVPAGASLVGVLGTIWAALHNNRTATTKSLVDQLQGQLHSLQAVAGAPAYEPDHSVTNTTIAVPKPGPSLILPGLSVLIDPSKFAEPVEAERKKITDAFDAFLKNLEPKGAAA